MLRLRAAANEIAENRQQSAEKVVVAREVKTTLATRQSIAHAAAPGKQGDLSLHPLMLPVFSPDDSVAYLDQFSPHTCNPYQEQALTMSLSCQKVTERGGTFKVRAFLVRSAQTIVEASTWQHQDKACCFLPSTPSPRSIPHQDAFQSFTHPNSARSSTRRSGSRATDRAAGRRQVQARRLRRPG